MLAARRRRARLVVVVPRLSSLEPASTPGAAFTVQSIGASSVDVGGRHSRGIHLWCHVMNWVPRQGSRAAVGSKSRDRFPDMWAHRSPGHHNLGSVGEPRRDLRVLGSDSSYTHSVIDAPT